MQDVDMVFAPIAVTLARETVMDASYPFNREYSSGIYKKPDESIQKVYLFLKQFQ